MCESRVNGSIALIGLAAPHCLQQGSHPLMWQNGHREGSARLSTKDPTVGWDDSVVALGHGQTRQHAPLFPFSGVVVSLYQKYEYACRG